MLLSVLIIPGRNCQVAICIELARLTSLYIHCTYMDLNWLFTDGKASSTN